MEFNPYLICVFIYFVLQFASQNKIWLTSVESPNVHIQHIATSSVAYCHILGSIDGLIKSTLWIFKGPVCEGKSFGKGVIQISEAEKEEEENEMLEATNAPRQNNSRLGCQVRVSKAMDGIVVRVPEKQ